MQQDGIVEQKEPDSLSFKKPLFEPHLSKGVIVIAGPTATGKSRLSLEIAKLVDGEIISADSVQVYRGMDIGTAKVPREERMEIPHHLIDIRTLDEGFNVVQFYEQATRVMRDILKRKRTPIVVGGTGFYLHSLVYGPPQGPPASLYMRDKLEDDIEKFGLEALYDRLKKYDPSYAQTINCGDKNKIVRALEIISLSGKKVSDFQRPGRGGISKEFDFRCWFIYFPTKILYRLIEMRCDEMIAHGLIEEVERLEKGLRDNLSANQAIGYRQCLKFLETDRSEEDWEQFVWEFKKESRHYAKRQFTWFRKEPLFRWIDIDIYGYQKVIELVIKDYEGYR